jgi:hypothetical protein
VLGAWALSCALALATHYYSLLIVLPQALWLLIEHRHRRAVMIAIALVAACGAALVPLALSQNATGNANWIGGIPLAPRLGQIVPQFLSGFGGPANLLLQRLAELLAAAALVLLALRADAGERRGAAAAGAIALGGLLINLILVAGGVDDLLTRNVLALWLPAAVLLAAGLGSSRAGLAGVLLAAALCAIGLVDTIAIAADRNLQRPDWRAVARVLGPGPPSRPGRRAILLQRYRDLLPLSLYLGGLRRLPSGSPATVKELDVVAISAPRAPLCWWGAACNLAPSPVQPRYPVPGMREVARVRTLQFTVVRLVSATGVPITRAILARALTTTTVRQDELLIQR